MTPDLQIILGRLCQKSIIGVANVRVRVSGHRLIGLGGCKSMKRRLPLFFSLSRFKNSALSKCYRKEAVMRGLQDNDVAFPPFRSSIHHPLLFCLSFLLAPAPLSSARWLIHLPPWCILPSVLFFHTFFTPLLPLPHPSFFILISSCPHCSWLKIPPFFISHHCLFYGLSVFNRSFCCFTPFSFLHFLPLFRSYYMFSLLFPSFLFHLCTLSLTSFDFPCHPGSFLLSCCIFMTPIILPSSSSHLQPSFHHFAPKLCPTLTSPPTLTTVVMWRCNQLCCSSSWVSAFLGLKPKYQMLCKSPYSSMVHLNNNLIKFFLAPDQNLCSCSLHKHTPFNAAIIATIVLLFCGSMIINPIKM